MNNAPFGKSMENVRNRINFRLITTEEQLYKIRNTLTRTTCFDENLIGLHQFKDKCKLNKPIYIGQTILDDSKTLMADFHYNFMLKKVERKNIDLLFTDTDSLCYNIRNQDIFKIMKENKTYFDLSNYDKNDELYDGTNGKINGKFKNESVKQIIAFCGLRPKMYSYLVDTDESNHCRAKGTKKSVAYKELTFDKYENTLFNKKLYPVKQNVIRSHQHKLYSETISKIGLSFCDDKVYIKDNMIETYNFGNKNIKM